MTKKEIKGTLIPIGGNEDKGSAKNENSSLDFVTEGILAHVVRKAGGPNSSIAVFTTASSIPDEVGENYLAAFDRLGCTKVQIMDVQSQEQANLKGNLSIIEAADCVMFSGGDQSRISDFIGKTEMHKLLLDRYLNEDFVIAGTSAGAMCMSAEMISGNSSPDSFFKGSVSMREGLGLAPELIIDSHFIQRGRFGRLAESVARFPHLLGVGLAEDTGLIIEKGNVVKVIGSGMVILMDPANLIHNNEKILEPGTPMTLTNLTTHVLSNSDGFFVDTRQVTVLPIDADFV